MSGYSRTGSRVKAMIPNSRMERLMTAAKTGRWMEIWLSFMQSTCAGYGRQ